MFLMKHQKTILIIVIIAVLAVIGTLLINQKGRPAAAVNENEAYLLGLNEISGACGLDLRSHSVMSVFPISTAVVEQEPA